MERLLPMMGAVGGTLMGGSVPLFIDVFALHAARTSSYFPLAAGFSIFGGTILGFLIGFIAAALHSLSKRRG